MARAVGHRLQTEVLVFVLCCVQALRAFDGGLLRFQLLNTTDGLQEFPPYQSADFVFMGNPNRRDPTTLFIAGDARGLLLATSGTALRGLTLDCLLAAANEQPALLAIHVLFMRNHNWWSDIFASCSDGAMV
jgi:hypothetical protein